MFSAMMCLSAHDVFVRFVEQHRAGGQLEALMMQPEQEATVSGMPEAGILLIQQDSRHAAMLSLATGHAYTCTLQCRSQDPNAATSRCTMMTTCTVFSAGKSVLGIVKGPMQYHAEQDYADHTPWNCRLIPADRQSWPLTSAPEGTGPIPSCLRTAGQHRPCPAT